MSLSTLLDIIWAEIYDDCPPLGDIHQYREVIQQLYIEGKDPHSITYTDAKGKTKRLATTPGHKGAPTKSAREQVDAMWEQARKLAEAKQLASPPSE